MSYWIVHERLSAVGGKAKCHKYGSSSKCGQSSYKVPGANPT